MLSGKHSGARGDAHRALARLHRDFRVLHLRQFLLYGVGIPGLGVSPTLGTSWCATLY